jgi:hypothetical protein
MYLPTYLPRKARLAREKNIHCATGIEEELFDKKQQMGISILYPVVTNLDGIN